MKKKKKVERNKREENRQHSALETTAQLTDATVGSLEALEADALAVDAVTVAVAVGNDAHVLAEAAVGALEALVAAAAPLHQLPLPAAHHGALVCTTPTKTPVLAFSPATVSTWNQPPVSTSNQPTVPTRNQLTVSIKLKQTTTNKRVSKKLSTRLYNRTNKNKKHVSQTSHPCRQGTSSFTFNTPVNSEGHNNRWHSLLQFRSRIFYYNSGVGSSATIQESDLLLQFRSRIFYYNSGVGPSKSAAAKCTFAVANIWVHPLTCFLLFFLLFFTTWTGGSFAAKKSTLHRHSFLSILLLQHQPIASELIWSVWSFAAAMKQNKQEQRNRRQFCRCAVWLRGCRPISPLVQNYIFD